MSWPFPPPGGPIPWTKKQEREYQQALKRKQQDEAPEAPF
jgi:hypothetical protein